MDATPSDWPSHRGAYWLKARGLSPGELSAPLNKVRPLSVILTFLIHSPAPFSSCAPSQAVLGYLSDFLFIGQGARALNLNLFSSHSPSSIPGRLDLDMMVSLDHQIAWYSDSYDTSAWLLHVMDVQRAGSGRAVVHGRLYTREGELVAVTSQEGVVRAKLEKEEGRKSKL